MINKLIAAIVLMFLLVVGFGVLFRPRSVQDIARRYVSQYPPAMRPTFLVRHVESEKYLWTVRATGLAALVLAATLLGLLIAGE